MKKCFKCKQSKSISDFYSHKQMRDGLLGKCKECTKSDSRNRYYSQTEKIIEYEIRRSKQPERRLKRMEYQRKRRLKYPEKNKARNLISNGLRSGKISKLPCEVCGELKSQAHHLDYSKPYDVIWLCRKHHMEAENKKSWV